MIDTGRLLLKRPEKEDLAAYFDIYRKPENNLYNPLGPVGSLQEATQRFLLFLQHWERHGFGMWKIQEQGGGPVIGFGGLSYRIYGHEEVLNLGYRFDAAYWGKGYATELARQAVRFGFDELQVTSIHALVRPDHTASVRVLEKCGLNRYGELDDVPGREKSIIYRIVNPERA